MFRLIAFLIAVPGLAAAEWSPLPRAFSYDATFARCIENLDRIDTQTCATLLQDAYVLNLAVAEAVAACATTPLATCTEPFEARGLPAIAARIAADTSCDTTPVSAFAPFEPLPQDHCITMISDILRDEGVVPLDAPLGDPQNGLTGCPLTQQICEDLIDIQGVFWFRGVIGLSDTPLTRQRSDAAWDACLTQSREVYAITACHAAALADIWVDLIRAKSQEL